MTVATEKTPHKSSSMFKLFSNKLRGNNDSTPAAAPAPVPTKKLTKAHTSAHISRSASTNTPHPLRNGVTGIPSASPAPRQMTRRSTGVTPTMVKSSKQLSTLTAHNSNPFRNKNGTISSASHTHNGPTNSQHMVYNPYGINNRPTETQSSVRGSSYSRHGSGSHISSGSASSTNNNTDLSFYMHDGDNKIRMLPLPIADPNEFLPDDIKQVSIHLSDNFSFDKDNKTIGSGGSSEVRIVRSNYRSKDVYALKKLNMIYDETPEKFYKRCSKEFIIAKQLSNNIHITSTFYLVKVPTTIYTTRGWGFIMELGSKDLFQLMEKSGWKNVPLHEKFCLFKQVAQGVKFCHDNGIAHRDLKPENVLLSKDGVCKLTDFGISDWYHKENEDGTIEVKQNAGMIGSPPYAPPEVMYWDAKKKYPTSMQKPYDPLKLDCYSLGIIFITLINNIIPFFESCNMDPKFREYENSYNNFIRYQNKNFRQKGTYKPGPGSEYMLARRFKNADASRVAWRLADPDPETRYTMEDLFNDPWFQSVETCVDVNDVNLVRHPQIKKTSSEGINLVNAADAHQIPSPMVGTDTNGGLHSDSENPAGTHTTEESVETPKPASIRELHKPRSMVDIAESPMKKAATTPLFTLDEEAKEKRDHEQETNTTAEADNEKAQTVPTSAVDTNEFASKENATTTDNDNVNTKATTADPTTQQGAEITETGSIAGSISASISASITASMSGSVSGAATAPIPRRDPSNRSIHSNATSTGTAGRKKKVVHHHMEVPGSAFQI